MKLPGRELLSICVTIILLVVIITMKQRCSQSVGQMFQALDTQPGAPLAPGGSDKVAPMKLHLDAGATK